MDQCPDCGLDMYWEIVPNSDNFSQFYRHVLEVYFGEDFDEVNNATVGVPAGTTTYSPGPLEWEKVYYWRVDEFDAVATHKADVWSFSTPGAVGNPQPAYGAADVPLNATLNWIPADSAASHQLYVGTYYREQYLL
ncbi:hypothetical protein ACFL5Z_21300, partial [Planctomycetota bacterium]